MNRLHEDLGFVVFDGLPPLDEVAAALPTPTRRRDVAPRRLALAATLHEGNENHVNATLFAMFQHRGKTLVAITGRVARDGTTHVEVALSRRYRQTLTFSTHVAAPRILRFQDGLRTGTVDEIDLEPR